MSRVHDALRRAEQVAAASEPGSEAAVQRTISAPAAAVAAYAPSSFGITPEMLSQVRVKPFTPAPDAHLIDVNHPAEPPAEEFRTLRTRLNHIQTQEAIHTVVISSPSPAEGKSFAAVNLALAESQLEGSSTLLVDCDFRRPIIHNLFQMERSPGLTDFLQGKAAIHECIWKIEGLNLYVLPAGEAVVNPLELLNRVEMKLLLEQLPNAFNWVMLDSPPLLFAADANLLSTLCHGTILVVRIGSTTVDSVTRAMQAFSENNVIGIIVNGARRGELYSKYTYYHSYYYSEPETEAEEPEPAN
jgi:receptor protein-tyrosine kinase